MNNIQAPAPRSPLVSNNLPQTNLSLKIEVINTLSQSLITDGSTVPEGTTAQIRIHNLNDFPIKVVMKVLKSQGDPLDIGNEVLKVTTDFNSQDQKITRQFAITDSIAINIFAVQLPLISGREIGGISINVIVVPGQ